MWPTLAQRFAGPSAARTYVVISAVFVCLILWRAFELAAVEPQGLWSRLVALALGALLFMFLRANPFRLEPKLV